MIHPTAIVHADAHIADGVSIGPYSVVGDDVVIGARTSIGSHVVIQGRTTIGSGNRIFSFCSLGTDPQDKKYHGESDSLLKIGSGNTIREYVSINRGTSAGGGQTIVKDNNWIMAYAHIAHDCCVGSHTIFANGVSLAGHVIIDDYVVLGGFTGVRQFCRIGRYSFSAATSVIVKDMPPYILVSGNTARPRGLNLEGLKRHQFSAEIMAELKEAYRILYRQGHRLEQSLILLEEFSKRSDEVAEFYQFIVDSKRGIIR